MRRTNEYDDRFSEESPLMEECDMVAIPTHKNDERRSRKPNKVEAKVGVAQSCECVGHEKRKIRSLRKDTRDLGPEDITVHTRDERTTVQLCRDSDVACRWINGKITQGTKYKDTIGKIQKLLHSWWKKGVAKPISDIDSFANHVHREHNQEADH